MLFHALFQLSIFSTLVLLFLFYNYMQESTLVENNKKLKKVIYLMSLFNYTTVQYAYLLIFSGKFYLSFTDN